jgi:hypothetical protein
MVKQSRDQSIEGDLGTEVNNFGCDNIGQCEGEKSY